MAAGLRRAGPRPIPKRKALHERLIKNELSPGWEDALPSWSADPKGIATRAASGKGAERDRTQDA